MEPIKHILRTPAPGMDPLKVADINDSPEDFYFDPFFEDDEGFVDAAVHEETLEELERRIEALKRAIDIAKLMSNVTTDDIINLADKVLDYLKNTQI